MGGPRLPNVRYILGTLVGHVTSVAQIKTVCPLALSRTRIAARCESR